MKNKGEKLMKKIFALTAVSMMLAATTAFASCPINPTNNSCSIHQTGRITGAAAPVSYIVAPVQQRTYLPPCNNCNTQQKKTFFQKVMTPFTGVYNAVFSPFTNLYD